VIAMIIDCQSCPVRDLHCADCMVTAMLVPQGAELQGAELQGAELPLDAVERSAVARFADAGLVSAHEASSAVARREPWAAHVRAVG
jgi:hypothetical protein